MKVGEFYGVNGSLPDFLLTYLITGGYVAVAAICRFLLEEQMASNDAVIAGLQSLEKRLSAQVARQEAATASVKTQLVAIREQIKALQDVPVVGRR